MGHSTVTLARSALVSGCHGLQAVVWVEVQGHARDIIRKLAARKPGEEMGG